MRSGSYTYLLLLIGFFLLNGATTDGTKIKPSGGCATITSEEKTTCKRESERSLAERTWCKQLKRFGRMCKLDVDCLIAKTSKSDKEIKDLENEIKQQADCENYDFQHVAAKNGFLLKSSKEGSTQIAHFKKGDLLSFMQRSKDDKSWWLVSTENCDQGYVKESFVKSLDEPPPVEPEIFIGDETNDPFIITSPNWTEKKELIKVPSKGFFDIVGKLNKSFGIDQITLNGEDLVIESDKSFSKTLLIKKDDLDIRIIAYKNKEQVGKPLIFKVKISN